MESLTGETIVTDDLEEGTINLVHVHEAASAIIEDPVEMESAKFNNLPKRILASEDDSEIGDNDHGLLETGRLQQDSDISDLINEKLNSCDDTKELAGSSTSMRLPFSFPGQSFSEQSQKLILNVWDFFKRAKKDPKLIHSLRGPQDHASAALNVGTKTIGKIAKRVLRLGKLETPGKKRNRPKTVLDSIGPEGEEVLRTIIREMYERRIAPTISLVLADAKERLDFKGSTTSLRRILKRMGFKYGGINNSLIQSDKQNISGWKEKPMKKTWRPSKKKNDLKKSKMSHVPSTEHLTKGQKESVPVQSSELIVNTEIIDSHEMMDSQEIIQPQEVIIHYQPKSSNQNDFLSQAGTTTQMITVTGAPSEIQLDSIQLQLESNGETVVQEWQWQQLQKIDDCSNDTILGVQSL